LTLPPLLQSNVSKSKVLLLRRFPFFGHLALSTPVRERNDIQVAASSSTTVYLNEEFFNNLDLHGQTYLLAHEILHLALQHHPRKRWRERTKWNVACDIVVNDILENQGMDLVEGVITKGRFDLDIEDLNVEAVYSLLPDVNFGEMVSDCPTGQDLADDVNGESHEEKNWDFQVKAAVKHAKLSYGDLPGWIERKIGLTRPEFDWVSILSYFVGSVSDQERSYRRLSKRHIWRDAIIPKGSNYKARIVVVIDASGSITKSMLDRFLAEVNSFSLTINTNVRLIVHDTMITLDKSFDPGHISLSSVDGGGGTDFIPVFEELSCDPPDGAIWFTDGYGRFPEEPPAFPVLWVMTKRHYEPPFGWRVVFDEV